MVRLALFHPRILRQLRVQPRSTEELKPLRLGSTQPKQGFRGWAPNSAKTGLPVTSPGALCLLTFGGTTLHPRSLIPLSRLGWRSVYSGGYQSSPNALRSRGLGCELTDFDMKPSKLYVLVCELSTV
jgi:hypothetical protein